MTVRALPVLDLPVRPAAGEGEKPRIAPRLEEYVPDPQILPRFHVWTLGCQMNRSDSEEMAGALVAAGCAEAASLDEADLIVINSCAIREAAEQKVIGRMGQLAALKRARPGTRVVLTGCAVRANNRHLLARRYPAVDLFLRPDEEPELVLRLGLETATTPSTRAAAVSAGAIRRESAWEAWVPVIYGCDKTCTYCIVPFSRGPERSRPFDEVVAECRTLAKAGVVTVTLLGQNVNSYGHDLPPEARFAGLVRDRPLGRRLDAPGRPDFAALLRAVDALRLDDGRPAIPRLRFVTSHPWDLTERLIEAIAECPSVCEHLHLPVQSGDDAVLRRMGRQYTAEGYVRLVEKLRVAVPGIALSTDVIVGFSGEDERRFETTLDLLRAVRYDQVFAAAYSMRPGTPAARLPDDVPPAVKRRRLNELLELQEGIGWELNRAWVGRRTEVFVDHVDERPGHVHGDEAQARTEAAGRGMPRDGWLTASGRNRENKLVHFPGQAEWRGRLVDVRVERAGPYSLHGSAVGSALQT